MEKQQWSNDKSSYKQEDTANQLIAVWTGPILPWPDPEGPQCPDPMPEPEPEQSEEN